ncbi:MAG: hypothetical protein ACFFCX_11715, partial [Candidatus Sifarchaeia archaeon]
GSFDGAPMLVVLDTTNSEEVDRASIDLWTNIDGISEALFKNLQQSKIGAVPDFYSSLVISWHIDKPDPSPRLVLNLSSSDAQSNHYTGEIFFSLDYQGLLSETFKTTIPLHQEQVSIAIDLGDLRSTWNGNLDSSYLTIFFGDSEWKAIDRFHKITYTWRDALIRQIENHLETGQRLNYFTDVSKLVNLQDTPEGTKAKALFFAFCLDSVVEGCKSQRVSDHCKRCVILSGLVICFNPKRGLSGYLEMILDGPDELAEIGSERTWRDHLSRIVTSAQDFIPVQVELKGTRKSRGPGRPPTQLLPTIPPFKLFRDFAHNPESIVCKYCRFSIRFK